MTDPIQFIIVTLAACAAAAAIIRPYVVRRPAAGCSGCPSARVRKPPSAPEIQPLRLFRR